MIVNIQHLQNQQLQQQIAKLANNLGQLHHRQINKGNKQANNEEKTKANKQTTNKRQLQKTLTGISIGDQRPFLHLIRPLPTSWKVQDFSISNYSFDCLTYMFLKKPMVHSPESMLQCNERRKVKLIWNTIAVKCLWILHWLIWFSPVSKLCQNHKTFLIAHTCCQYNDSSDGQKYVSNKVVKAIGDP